MSDSHPSTADQHKRIIRRLYRDVWTAAEFDNVAELLAPHFTFHVRGRSFEQDPEDLLRIVRGWKEAFPDIRFQVLDVIAEGDLASARVVYRGTHQGAWKGIPATGRKVEVFEMLFFRFAEGRIVEVWEVVDEYALRHQLGGTGR